MAPVPGGSRMSQRLQDTLMRYGQVPGALKEHGPLSDGQMI